LIEFASGPVSADQLDKFRRVLDQHLCGLNADYADHRAGDYGLKLPDVDALEAGTFRAWMKERGQLGGQHKVPRIINDPNLFADLIAFVSRSCPAGRKPER
jgi:hypothetical protein